MARIQIVLHPHNIPQTTHTYTHAHVKCTNSCSRLGKEGNRCRGTAGNMMYSSDLHTSDGERAWVRGCVRARACVSAWGWVGAGVLGTRSSQTTYTHPMESVTRGLYCMPGNAMGDMRKTEPRKTYTHPIARYAREHNIRIRIKRTKGDPHTSNGDCDARIIRAGPPYTKVENTTKRVGGGMRILKAAPLVPAKGNIKVKTAVCWSLR